jgi:hypothetical protein
VITNEGQEYVDRPVYLHANEISLSVAQALNAQRLPVTLPTDQYQRVRLKWMKPQNGKLVRVEQKR